MLALVVVVGAAIVTAVVVAGFGQDRAGQQRRSDGSGNQAFHLGLPIKVERFDYGRSIGGVV